MILNRLFLPAGLGTVLRAWAATACENADVPCGASGTVTGEPDVPNVSNLPGEDT